MQALLHHLVLPHTPPPSQTPDDMHRHAATGLAGPTACEAHGRRVIGGGGGFHASGMQPVSWVGGASFTDMRLSVGGVLFAIDKCMYGMYGWYVFMWM